MKIPTHKPAATEIVMVGSGLSLDLANPSEYADQPDRIVIALNVASSLIAADYIVLTDHIAYAGWIGNAAKRPGQYAVVLRRVAGTHAEGADVPQIVAENVLMGPHSQFERHSFNNARSLAVGLSEALFCQHPRCKRVVYIGMDCGVFNEFDRAGRLAATWTYANRLRPYALTKRVAWMHSPYRVPHAGLQYKPSHYANVLTYVQGIRTRTPRWWSALECRSFFDWKKAGLPPRYNAREAHVWPANRNEVESD